MEIPNDVLIGTAGEGNFYFIILCKYFPTVYTLVGVQCPFLFTFLLNLAQCQTNE